ncbi:reverse transcriptase domain-containing protein [Tanacetum coccineum]
MPYFACDLSRTGPTKLVCLSYHEPLVTYDQLDWYLAVDARVRDPLFQADPSESSLPLISVAPMVSSFLCLDDSKSNTKMHERHVSPTPYDAMFTRALNVRKSVRPLPSHRLALRYTSHRLDRFTFGSSSDHSSFGNSILSHYLSGHTPPDITIVDSSAPSRFVYPPLFSTSWYSKDYRRWRSAPLSTMYPSMTSKSSAGDSSFESSAGPSRKRYRSLAATVTLSIHALRALVPSHADLLPPCKRFMDSISPEDNGEEDIDTDVLADIEVDATAIEVAVDMDAEFEVEAGIGMEVYVGVDVENEVEDEVEEVVKDIYGHVMEIPLQRVEDIETGQRELEVRSLITSVERYSLLEQVASLERSNARLRGILRMERARADRRLETFVIMTITRSGMTLEVIEELINQRVAKALAAYEANYAAKLAVESQSQNGDDDDNGNVKRNRNGNDGENGDGNSGGGNGNGNPNRNDRGDMPVACECTYHDFVMCQPLNFKGTEGVFGLTRWFEKMERVFHISNCPERYQVKYAPCTLLNSALTWWNVHKRTIGADAAFAMSWIELMKLMTEMVPEEEDQVEKFIGGLPDNIQGNVIAAEPTRLQDAVCIANNLIDQKLKGYAVKNAKNKRRFNNNQKDNHVQQPLYKRQNISGQGVARAYTAGSNEKKGYAGPLPYCNKLNQRVPTCFECGRQGHHRNECPKLKNQTRGNKAGKKTNEARGKAYVLGGGEANPNSNVVTGTFLLNNHYASMLFDSSIDMSFMSSTFSALLDVIPSMLDISYGVKLADRRVAETNTVLRGCTLGLLGHPFNIDLMHVELGSFDVIIGMDWLANHHAVIVCDEKIVWIPYGDEVLTVQETRNNSITIAYRFKITLQLCLFDGSKPKNNDELQPILSNFFKNFDSNGGDDLCYQGGLDQRFSGLYHQNTLLRVPNEKWGVCM